MTHGDNIRSMTDDTLAILFTEINILASNRVLAAMGQPEDFEKHRDELYKDWLDLLKSEVPDNG